MTRIFSFLIVLFLIVPSIAMGQAEVMIDITKKTRPEVTIAIMRFVALDLSVDKFGLGEKGRQILENDLRLSELFQPVQRDLFTSLESDKIGQPQVDYDAWSRLGVQWLVNAQYAVSKNNKLVTVVFRLYDIVNDQFLLGKRYRGDPGNLRKIIHRFADEVVDALTGKPGLAGTQIAFLSRNGSGKEIYTVDFDGFNPKKVTNENSVVLSPAWSPDGNSIAFTSYADKNPNLVMVDLKSGRRKTLVDVPGLNTAPDWSPDGEKIALVLSKDKNSEIYTLDKNSKLDRLTNHFSIDTSPTWSPDGKNIAFTSDRSGTGSPQIYIMDSQGGDGLAVQRITFGSSYNDNPAWSPDGDKMAYNAREGGIFQIHIYDLTTKKVTMFTSGRGNKEKPAWSPDGRFIAFMMKNGGRPEIFVKRVGGEKVRRITSLPTGGGSPTWSPYRKK